MLPRIVQSLMKKSSVVDRMKTKNFYIVIGFIVVTSGSLWLISFPSPTFQNIVTKTHKGIKNLPSNIQIRVKHQLTIDPIYLTHLGLNSQTQSNEGVEPSKSEYSLVVGSSVEPEKFQDAVEFMESVRKNMAGYRLVMYDLGLSQREGALLKKYCNSSWNCVVQVFDFQKYPSHVAELSIKSYRPICIQEMLNTYNAVIWADEAEFFLPGNWTPIVVQAKETGLAAWTIEDPTSAITHPKMFDYFETKQSSYYFHRAVETSHIVIYGKPDVKNKIMLPWVKCALLEGCINPTGAQNAGCNFFRKPLFLYSGCHYYDMSALNVILGQVFEYDERGYASKETVFGNLIDDRLAAKNDYSYDIMPVIPVVDFIKTKSLRDLASAQGLVETFYIRYKGTYWKFHCK